jgi:site-specific DNA-cytosine methylase
MQTIGFIAPGAPMTSRCVSCGHRDPVEGGATGPMSYGPPCHQRDTGATYQAVYSRMSWNEPSPTMTTLSHSFGSARFGHPEQDRALTLREAARLQSFPRRYRFSVGFRRWFR